MALESVADARRLGYVGSTTRGRLLDRDSDAWYTPTAYVEAARDVMGGIDLDPFSSAWANRSIHAARYFDVDQSAFDHAWRRTKRHDPVRVWMNPPYSTGVINRAVDCLLSQWDAGDIEQAVVLTNNATDTRWFHMLRQACLGICFTDHRIAFVSPDGKRISGNTRGQTFFYFGSPERAVDFIARFSSFGWCVSKTRGWA